MSTAPEDQPAATRLKQFRVEHPDVTIDRAGKPSSDLWRAHRDGVVIVVAVELDDVIGKAEDRL
jgi:hypothetical protein